MTEFTHKAKVALLMTQILLIVLIGFISAWTLAISPPPQANPITITLFQVVPLALFLPGVLMGSQRTCVWLCFVILVYFCSGVIWAMSPVQMIFGLGESLLTVALFTSAMLYVRWYGKDQKALALIEQNKR